MLNDSHNKLMENFEAYKLAQCIKCGELNISDSKYFFYCQYCDKKFKWTKKNKTYGTALQMNILMSTKDKGECETWLKKMNQRKKK